MRNNDARSAKAEIPFTDLVDMVKTMRSPQFPSQMNLSTSPLWKGISIRILTDRSTPATLPCTPPSLPVPTSLPCSTSMMCLTPNLMWAKCLRCQCTAQHGPVPADPGLIVLYVPRRRRKGRHGRHDECRQGQRQGIYGKIHRRNLADVAGQDEAKESLVEIIDFLHNPGKYTAIGQSCPRARCWSVRRAPVNPAGQSRSRRGKVPFFSISGSDFVEMFVGGCFPCARPL